MFTSLGLLVLAGLLGPLLGAGKRLRVPVLVGELIGGIILGRTGLHLIDAGAQPFPVFASLGFAGLTLWPAAAAQKSPEAPWGLRLAPAVAAVALQFALLAWFGTELILGAHQVGLAERIMGGAQATWPLAVVLSCYLPARKSIPVPKVNQASNA